MAKPKIAIGEDPKDFQKRVDKWEDEQRKKELADATAAAADEQGGQAPSARTQAAPTNTGDAAIPNTVGIQTGAQQVAARSQVLQNVQAPQIPQAGLQTAERLETGEIAGGRQFQDAAQVSEQVRIRDEIATTGGIIPAEAREAEAARMQAVAAAPQVDTALVESAAQSNIDKLVDPQTGAISHEAVAAQGRLDPGALVEAATTTLDQDGEAVAATADLPTKALMTTQLDNLLTDLEGGNVPSWARPAVDSVEAALAQRGLSRSSIGRDALFNAIVQSALPLAQDNARAEQARAAQNLSNEQQAAMFNAQAKLNINLANLSNEQQAAVMNSQTIQTMTLTNLNNEQQAVMQNAAAWAAMDQANLSAAQQAQVQNAQNFLQMNLANLSNRQQTKLFNSQSRIQSILTDQAAENSARQFNAANEQQTSQFMAQLGTQVSQYNASQYAAMEQFNAGQLNAHDQFVAQNALAREQFNAQMINQIEQSNVQWRRQINQIDTAGQNAVNQANAINAFNLSNQALTLMWQDLRDSAQWSFQAGQNKDERDTRLAIAALSNEQDRDKRNAELWQTAGAFVSNLIG